MKTIKIIRFENTGIPISDYKIAEFVDIFLKSDKLEVSVSTHLVIDEIRARIAEGTLNHEDVEICVDGYPFNIDKDGRSNDWQPIQEIHTNILTRILVGNKFKS